MTGPVTRTRAMQAAYIEYLTSRTSNPACAFCEIPVDQPETIVSESKTALVVENRFGYSIWEGCKVIEHLMVIPKKHRHALSEFTKQEQAEWMKLTSEYEAAGYSLYTRSPDSITKSVAHHHTHFIKLESKRKKFMLYFRKPHLLLTR